MPDQLPESFGDHSSGDREKEIQELFAVYMDRLNRGEKLDADAIIAENPHLGRELLEYLEDFIEAGSEDTEMSRSLGTLGDYTLRRQIGRGGMGVVYEAWQNSVDRQVALKVLPAGIAADAKAVGRFAREARVAAKLQHPNVVSVFGMGVEAETPYYSMEFVEGETLAQILGRLRSVAGGRSEGDTREVLSGLVQLLGKGSRVSEAGRTDSDTFPLGALGSEKVTDPQPKRTAPAGKEITPVIS